MRKLLLPILGTLFVLSLVIFPSTALQAARDGLKLWFSIVLPSLFPFFVGAEILYKTNIVRILGVLMEPVMRPFFNLPGCGSFPFLMGLTSGYPVGAKLTASLREEQLLTKSEAERLLAFSNNSGPLFIIGAVGVGMYHMQKLGFLLLGCHIAACITVGILFGLWGRRKGLGEWSERTGKSGKRETKTSGQLLQTPPGLGHILGDAIKSAMTTILTIGGFIVFFSVLIQLLLKTGVIHGLAQLLALFTTAAGIRKPVVSAVLGGFFEITTGTNMTSMAAGTPFIQQVTAASMIIGWAGLSVHSQVLTITGGTDLSIRPYLLGKCLQGALAGIYTYVMIKTAGHQFLADKPAFFPLSAADKIHWQDCLLISGRYFLLSLILILALSFLGILIRFARRINFRAKGF